MMELLKEDKNGQVALFKVESGEKYQLDGIFVYKGDTFIINSIVENLILAKKI